ncbi:Diguanylate cyclase YdeH [Marinomonas spartinae]|uniref:diguanylate cyclase n=1 Tax=Marinomonas spartinae TaxID=1792290 RepID=A0A1A8T9M9_9GAMM|nr:GGDEF domain-containing protein [Marinomonas spartinae]SBS28318.1 Diguanylate cyclase YdeH [Marinomonas spartinae]SBS28340.1 Diguanylate cyclase YdeH [Marinomonas spartinae]
MIERFRSLLIPCFIFLASVYGSLYISYLPPLWVALLPWLPVILSVVAVLLAWRFNKGRVLVVICLLLVPKVYGHSSTESVSAYLAVSCFCIALLSFVRERGFFNRFVVNRFLFISMLLAWCYAVDAKWVSFSFLEQPFLSFQITWSTLLLWCVLAISVIVTGCSWWLAGDVFCANALMSIVGLMVMSLFSVSQDQVDLLLSAQCLVWLFFLLMESHRMAYLDELTTLPGRRALNESLLGLSGKYALVMVDVDHFKAFNDTYGHDMGDRVLTHVARQVQRFSYPGRVYRFGGEEFTVIFRAKVLNDIEPILDEVKAQIEDMPVEVYDPKKKKVIETRVTASFGVALSAPGELADAVLIRADKALYQAKRKGRNCIVFSKSTNHRSTKVNGNV